MKKMRSREIKELAYSEGSVPNTDYKILFSLYRVTSNPLQHVYDLLYFIPLLNFIPNFIARRAVPPTSSVSQHPQSIIIFSRRTGVNGTVLHGEAIRTLVHAEPKEVRGSNTEDEYNHLNRRR